MAEYMLMNQKYNGLALQRQCILHAPKPASAIKIYNGMTRGGKSLYITATACAMVIAPSLSKGTAITIHHPAPSIRVVIVLQEPIIRLCDEWPVIIAL